MKLTAKARSERTRNAWRTRKAAKAGTNPATEPKAEASSGPQAMTESPVQAARRLGWHEGYQQGADEARQHAEDTRIAEFANFGRRYEASGVPDDKVVTIQFSVGTLKMLGRRLTAKPSVQQMYRAILSEATGEWRQVQPEQASAAAKAT